MGLENDHIRQGRDLCGPACAEMLLRACGITHVTQHDIAHEYQVLKHDWGSPPDRIESFFKHFFTEVGTKTDMTLSELKDHIDTGCTAITLIQDIFPDSESTHSHLDDRLLCEDDGHYITIIDVNIDNPDDAYILVADPSNAERQYDDQGFVRTKVDRSDSFEFRPFYKIQADVFKKIWYDKFENGHVYHGVIIWFDPNTKTELALQSS